MEALVRRRGRAKAAITRIENFVLNHEGNVNVNDFIVRKDHLEKAFNDYEGYQNEIEDGDETQEVDRIEIEEKYFNVLSNIKTVIQTQNSFVQEAIQSKPSHSAVSHTHKAQVKLPNLDTPVFSGKIEDFPSFMDLFTALIGQNSQLSDVQKFMYLKSSLRNEPLDIVNNLSITNENYAVAMSLLKKRFDKKLVIINAHIKGLLDVPQMTKRNSVVLRQFITQINKHLNSLKALNVEVVNWDLLLIFIYSKHLDYQTKQMFEQQREAEVLPKLDEFLAFLEKRCSTLETLSGGSNVENKPKFPRATYLSNETSDSTNIHGCMFCKLKNHTLYKCFKFSKTPAMQRKQFITKNKLCLNCFGSKHTVTSCNSSGCCRVCGEKHHSLLHECYSGSSGTHGTQASSSTIRNSQVISAQPVTGITFPTQETVLISGIHQNTSQTEERGHISESACLISQNSSQILLATAKVIVVADNGMTVTTRALLDSASQTTVVTSKLVKRLGISSQRRDMQISGIANNKTTIDRMVNLTLRSPTHSTFFINASCAILDKITCALPHAQVDVAKLPIPDNLPLADVDFSCPAEVDMLIGADLYFDMIKLGPEMPTMQYSYFGWIIGGPAPIHTSSLISVSLFVSDLSVDELIPKFWHLEEYPYKKFLSPEDKMCENIFANTTQRLPDGSFQVNLPLKNSNDALLLGESFGLAAQRFYSLEKRFARDKESFSQYKDFINEYVKMNHGKYIPLDISNKESPQRYYFPHHCVLKTDSPTTKLRVVFDGSMKTTSGYSLNDILMKGPTVQPELFDIICRFRTFKYVFTADIQKMYRQVKINPDQLHLQNILWRDNPNDALQCIELQTVTYGTKSAPYLATKCLVQLAQDNIIQYPLASVAILNQCYVDDILTGANSVNDLEILRLELENILKTGGFHLHKWCFNEKVFISNTTARNTSQEVVLKDDCNKVLGITWNPGNDIFKVTFPTTGCIRKFTKREVLSRLSQLFDPLGFVNPIIVKAKLLMQQIWQRKLDWDEQLPQELIDVWKMFSNDITDLSQITIPRWIFSSLDYEEIQLHGYSDASMAAYGAVVYIRTIYQDKSASSVLICSKSRVAPLKTVSLPRLELCGALLLSKLIYKLKFTFSFPFSKTVLWTDSQIVLCWLKGSPSRWTTFVANRVAEIQELTISCEWNHIKSSDNPADLITRGCDTMSLISNDIWWHGPHFLRDHKFEVENTQSPIDESSIPEKRKVTIHTQNIEKPSCVFSRFSTFSRLQRSVAYCLRFINNCRKNTVKLPGPLSVAELYNSLHSIVKCIQLEHFSNEISLIQSGKDIKDSSVQSLSPFLDEQGVLRVGGRLLNAPLAYEQKHPILLPKKTYVVDLLIHHEHIRLNHAGPQTVLSNLRLRYWPLNGLRQSKTIIHNCVKCFRFKATQGEQLMGNLPPERVSMVRPFLNVGVDFRGPLSIKQTALRKAVVSKAYIALFVCMNTKAIHLELVSSLTTEAFIHTLKRFVARRGNPICIFSDNAGNFHGANNSLNEVYKFFKSRPNVTVIEEFLTSIEITWKFIPTTSPHWGGLWEAGIKSTKYFLRRIVGNIKLTFEQLTTVLAQIEGTLNSRPLCALSSDPSDFSCLTPGHFLIGDTLTSFPEKDLSRIPDNRRALWDQCSKIRQHFWKRFSVDYLNRLQHKPKWLKSVTNLKENVLVLVKEDHTPPLLWILARVIKVMPGRDGKVRVAEIKTKDGVFICPITKLAPLPLH